MLKFKVNGVTEKGRREGLDSVQINGCLNYLNANEERCNKDEEDDTYVTFLAKERNNNEVVNENNGHVFALTAVPSLMQSK